VTLPVTGVGSTCFCTTLSVFPDVHACPLALGTAHCLQVFLPSYYILALRAPPPPCIYMHSTTCLPCIQFLVHILVTHAQTERSAALFCHHFIKPNLMQTVANLGTISAVNLKGPGASDSWTAMTNTYGAAWEVSNQPSYPISLEVTSGSQTVSSSSCMR